MAGAWHKLRTQQQQQQHVSREKEKKAKEKLYENIYGMFAFTLRIRSVRLSIYFGQNNLCFYPF